MKKYPVKYIKSETLTPVMERALSVFPNAGPHPNITGMRRVWGESNIHPLFLVMYQSYLYNVNSKFYHYV